MMSGDLRVAPEAKSTRPGSTSNGIMSCRQLSERAHLESWPWSVKTRCRRTVDHGCKQQDEAQQWHPKVTDVAGRHGATALH